MLSFEMSVVDIVLTIAVIILFILYLAQSSADSRTKTQSSFSGGTLRKGQAMTVESNKRDKKTDIWECPHSFGYLRDLHGDASIPSECLTCSRVLECSSKD